VPLGKWDEARALAEEAMAARAAQLSPQHPAIADYLAVVARVKRSEGKVAEAKADFERVRDIRLAVFGLQHLKSAESIEALAGFEKDRDKRKAMLEEALAIATAPANVSPRTPFIEYSIESGLAEIAGRSGDQAGMQRHFDRAIALTEQISGPDSLDVGMMLVGYGQYMSEVDLGQSIAKLTHAVEILDRFHDPRAEIARSALAMILMRAKRYADALPLLERAVAGADLKNIEPFNLATMRFSLATALAETHGDRARARALATQALDGYRALGPDLTDNAKQVQAWLKAHR
jgi:tetratricopeptide (TPR) repeat protein